MDTVAETPKLTAAQVLKDYEKLKGDRVRSGSIASANWVTTLAHQCEAFAVYNRTVPPERRRALDHRLGYVFSEGDDQARIVKRDLEEMGYEVRAEEGQMSWPAYQITGRRDFHMRKRNVPGWRRVEVKSCSPFTFDAINSQEELEKTPKDWLSKWYRQVALYMILQSQDEYWMLLKCKTTGRIKIIEFKMNDAILHAGEAMIAKAERVNKLVAIGENPPSSSKLADPDVCGECQFFTVCLPEMEYGPGAVVLTDETAQELALMLERRRELEPSWKEYKTIDDDIKDSVKAVAAEGQSKVVIGDWVASIKESQKKSYTVQAMTVRSVKFIKIESEASGEKLAT